MPQSYEEKKKQDPGSVVRKGEMPSKAAAATKRLEKRSLKRKRLGRNLTSKKRGFMSPGGSLVLGRRK